MSSKKLINYDSKKKKSLNWSRYFYTFRLTLRASYPIIKTLKKQITQRIFKWLDCLIQLKQKLIRVTIWPTILNG